MPLLVNDNGTMAILTSDIYGYSDDGKTAFQFFSGKTVNSGYMIVNVKSDFYDSANFHKSVTMSGLPWNSSASAAVPVLFVVQQTMQHPAQYLLLSN